MAEFNLKTALNAVSARRTALQKKEFDDLQKRGRARLNRESAQERAALARRQEEDMLAKLKLVRSQPASPLRDQRQNQIMDRLSELAAEQGDYGRAVTLAHSPERRDYYRKVRAAIRIKDETNCTCDDDRLVDRARQQEFTSPAIMPVDTIVTPTGAKRLDRCRKCGFMNAR